MVTEQEAKFYRDVGVMERVANNNVNKATAVLALGIDPNNYDNIIKEKKKEDEDKLLQARLDVQEAYHLILEILDEFMDVSEDKKKIIAIWIIGTYCHKRFSTFPFLFFNAMRGSGKTRLLKLISWMQYKGNGDVLNNPSEAVVFRTAQETGLIFDEMEKLRTKDAQTMREILQQAYKKGGKIKRMKKVHKDKEEKQVVEEFDVFTPVAMANINGMDEVLGDRCITLVLEKSNKPNITKKIENFDTNPKIVRVKQLLQVLVTFSEVTLAPERYTTHWNQYIDEKYNITSSSNIIISLNSITPPQNKIPDELFEFYNKVDEAGIDGRHFEITFPLLITAKIIHEEIFDEVLKVLKNVVVERKDEEIAESKDVSLYNFIAGLKSYRFQWVMIKDLTRQFRESMGEQELEDQWLNERWVGRALKRLALIHQSRKLGSGRQVILDIDKANEKCLIFKKDEGSQENDL